MKVACSGSSGSGKTTIVKFIESEFGLQHISGSAGDIQTDQDRYNLKINYGYAGGMGHEGVIIQSAMDPKYGILNQQIIQKRREELIRYNNDFVTDRSPADNLVYLVNQCGFHSICTDELISGFAKDCLNAWKQLTHVIYIKAVQPNGVENNHSRVANWWYQQSIDAQFDHWIFNFFIPNTDDLPEVLVLDYWDLEYRKREVKEFLTNSR